MNAPSSLPRHVLDEDIQIVRATLASITDELARLSPKASKAVNEAVEKLDQAHAEFMRMALAG